MDAKELKVALKNAREAIRNKEFKEALKQCKSVLSKDENNYMALVLVAVAAEGLEQVDQAVKTYKRAIEADNSQLLAWQGLCACYEKHPKPELVQDHISVYLKVAELNKSDKDKRFDIGLKVSKLINDTNAQSDVQLVIDLLQAIIKDEDDSTKQLNLQTSLLCILPFLKDDSGSDMMTSMASDVLDKTDSYDNDVETILALYLSALVKKTPEKMSDVCNKLMVKFSKSVSVLEYMLVVMLDSYIGQKTLSIQDNLEDIFNTYKENTSVDEHIVNLVEAFMALCRSDHTTATNLLNQITDSSYVCVGYYRAMASLKCHNYEQVRKLCDAGIKLLGRKDRILTASSSNTRQRFNVIKVTALCASGEKQSLSDALDTIEHELDSSNEEVSLLKGNVLLRQGQIEEAKTCTVGDSVGRFVLDGLINMFEGNYTEAATRFSTAIEMEPGVASHQVNLAKCLWKLSDRRHECYPLLLKAAKLDPRNSDTFLYLGHYYSREAADDTRARKCYTKAYDLDPRNDEAGESLCDLLNKLGEEDKAHKIVVDVTGQAPAGCAKWAWLRLGLYQMKHEDPSDAIRSLLLALSTDPNNIHILECLGEAYLARGSYTASLKVFTKVSQLAPDSTYPLFQLASIKQTLGTFTEAIEEYKLILEKSPNYVPALKGIGESYVQVARSLLSKCFYGRARDTSQLAFLHLTRAVCVRSDMSCLWKLMGDACTILHVLPAEGFMFEKADKSVFSKQETLEFGGRCYIKALKILPECSSLWHDLGVNYMHQSLSSTQNEAAIPLAETSVQSLKKAIELEPANHLHWNALGYMACQKVYNKPDLAQHCFIKSIQVERNNVTAWTNLAALYLSKENVTLAHEAFKIAQSLEPSYVQCWIGQAIIAEVVGHEDAMDLFRHTTELGNHVESAIGYGHWVCMLLQNVEKRDTYMYMYAIDQMGAIPAASDALAKYTDRVTTNAMAYNMYGLLLERQKLYKTAAHQFKLAINIMEKIQSSSLCDVLCNYARVLGKSGDYTTACEVYRKIPTPTDFTDLCHMGLAFYKINDLQQSYQVYQQASELATTEPDRSHVLAATAMVMYKYGDLNNAKTTLFQGSQMCVPSVAGLKALCALGLVQSDVTLAEATLQELFSVEDSISHLYDITLLSVAVNILKGDLIEVKRQVQRLIHNNPCQSGLWQLLSTILLKYFPELGKSAAQTARISLLMEAPRQQVNMFLVSLGELYSGSHGDDTHNALLSAQRSILVKPDNLENWICLASCVHAEAMVTSDWNRKLGLLKQELLLLSYIQKQDISVEIKLWCMKQRVVCTVSSNMHDDLMDCLDELMTEFGSSADVQQLFKVFSNVLQNNCNGVISAIENSTVTYYWQILVDMYVRTGLIKDVENTVKACSGMLPDSAENILRLKLAHAAFVEIMRDGSNSDYCQQLFTTTVDQLLLCEGYDRIVYLMQGVINLKQNQRLSKHQLEKALSCPTTEQSGYDLSIARQALLYILTSMKKDTDLIQNIIREATAADDTCTLEYYNNLVLTAGKS